MRMLSTSSETYLQDAIALLKRGENAIVFVADNGSSVTVTFPPYQYDDDEDEEIADLIEQFLDDQMDPSEVGGFDA